MGRPPKPKAERRTAFVKIMLTVAEKKALAAVAAGQDLSTWARATLLETIGYKK